MRTRDVFRARMQAKRRNPDECAQFATRVAVNVAETRGDYGLNGPTTVTATTPAIAAVLSRAFWVQINGRWVPRQNVMRA